MDLDVIMQVDLGWERDDIDRKPLEVWRQARTFMAETAESSSLLQSP